MTTVASSDANCFTVSPTSWNSPIAEIDAGRDVHEDAVRAGQVDVLEQRARHRRPRPRSARGLRRSPTPEPIIAMPISDITVRTSAKSTLIKPGRVISSAMPCTAPCSTSFAALNASSSVVVGPEHRQQLLVRDRDQRVDEPAELRDALLRDPHALRRLPCANGFVTTATVRIPISFASCATTGAAPVPVPPPRPAVMNSMSAPSITSWIRSRSSIAACRPTSGFAPAPRPFVMLQPICRPGLHLRALQRLRVGVRADEVDALDAGSHHVRDRVAAAATDAEHLDDSRLAVSVHQFEHS